MFIVMVMYSGNLMAEKAPQEVCAAAQQGLDAFRGDEFNLGFTNPEDWQKATLGSGFQIFTIK